MKNGTTQRGTQKSAPQAATLTVVPGTADTGSTANLRATPGSTSRGSLDSGILVREEEMTAVKAQRLYKMRCECGRSWFELELPRFVQCPACKKPGLVSA